MERVYYLRSLISHQPRRRGSAGKRRRLKFLLLRSLGNFLFMFALYGILMTFLPVAISELTFRSRSLFNNQKETTRLSSLPKTNEPSPTATPEPDFGKPLNQSFLDRYNPKDNSFGIVIPKIGANSTIISNVNPAEPAEYLPALKKGVAHSLGSYFPGQGRKVYLFAHSTDTFWNIDNYNAVFYLLKELEKGDEIALFYRQKIYLYKVSEIVIAEPSEVSYLTNPSEEEVLFLQTCWPPGTTQKRLIVIARPVAPVLN